MMELNGWKPLVIFYMCLLLLLTPAQCQQTGNERTPVGSCYYTFLVEQDGLCMVESDQLREIKARLNQQEVQLQSLLQHSYLPKDCNTPQITRSGVYLIKPSGYHGNPFHVYCNITDNDGIWTVIQRRLDGSVDFYRDWQSYKDGFGNWRGEYWLGNEKIYFITNQAEYKLQVNLEDWDGNTRYAEYLEFWVDKETEGYRLHVGQYSGNAGDSLTYHNGQKFSTKDRDNDGRSSGNCVDACKGGWWYKDCYKSNINAIYYPSGSYSVSAWDGLDWIYWKNSHYSMKTVTMQLQRLMH